MRHALDLSRWFEMIRPTYFPPHCYLKQVSLNESWFFIRSTHIRLLCGGGICKRMLSMCPRMRGDRGWCGRPWRGSATGRRPQQHRKPSNGRGQRPAAARLRPRLATPILLTDAVTQVSTRRSSGPPTMRRSRSPNSHHANYIVTNELYTVTFKSNCHNLIQ